MIAPPALAVFSPLLVLLVLVACLLRRLTMDAGRLTRLLIATVREFVADAEAVRLTHDPAALTSALRLTAGAAAWRVWRRAATP